MHDINHLIEIASKRKKITVEQATTEINEIFESKTNNYMLGLALSHYFEDQTQK